MMDVQEYIASGILDLYVMGALNRHEMTEVERMSELHPEIREEIDALRRVLNAYIGSLAVNPPAGLRDKLLNVTGNGNISPTKSIQKNRRGEGSVFFKYFAIAASIALLISVGFNIYLVSSKSQLKSTVEDNQDALASLDSELRKVYQDKSRLEEKITVMTSPQTKLVHLIGMQNEDRAMVFWNIENNAVHLSIDQLAAAPKGHQYQLWAIVDNQPVDLGVFESDMKSFEIHPMGIVENPDAFAVTIEKMGGSNKPTLESMWLKGSI